LLAGETADDREPGREQMDEPGNEIARFRLDFVSRPTIASSRKGQRYRRERIEDRNFEVIGGGSEMAHDKSLRVGAAAPRLGRRAGPIQLSMPTRFKYRLIIVFIAADYPGRRRAGPGFAATCLINHGGVPRK
jgi:hypothetical protein